MEEAVASEDRDVPAGAIEDVSGLAEGALAWFGFGVGGEIILCQHIKGQLTRRFIRRLNANAPLLSSF